MGLCALEGKELSSQALATPAQAGRGQRRLARLLLSEYLPLGMSILFALAVMPLVPELFTVEVAGNILSDLMPLLVVAIGQTIVMVVKGIDLSVTAIIALASVAGASVMSGSGGWLAGQPYAVPVALVVMLLVGLGVGAFNGLAITRLNMPPFIATLTSMMFFSGAAIWYTSTFSKTTSFPNLPSAFTDFTTNRVAGIPLPACLALAMAMLAHVLLSRARLGHWWYAVGRNAQAAHVSGIPVGHALMAAYVVCGGYAAVASMIYTSRLQTGSPILGERILLDVIAAVVIGGTSLFGGRGKIIWTIFGVLFLVLVDTTLKLLGAQLFMILVIKGGVILVAAVLDALRNRMLDAL